MRADRYPPPRRLTRNSLYGSNLSLSLSLFPFSLTRYFLLARNNARPACPTLIVGPPLVSLSLLFSFAFALSFSLSFFSQRSLLHLRRAVDASPLLTAVTVQVRTETVVLPRRMSIQSGRTTYHCSFFFFFFLDISPFAFLLQWELDNLLVALRGTFLIYSYSFIDEFRVISLDAYIMALTV